MCLCVSNNQARLPLNWRQTLDHTWTGYTDMLFAPHKAKKASVHPVCGWSAFDWDAALFAYIIISQAWLKNVLPNVLNTVTTVYEFKAWLLYWILLHSIEPWFATFAKSGPMFAFSNSFWEILLSVLWQRSFTFQQVFDQNFIFRMQHCKILRNIAEK